MDAENCTCGSGADPDAGWVSGKGACSTGAAAGDEMPDATLSSLTGSSVSRSMSTKSSISLARLLAVTGAQNGVSEGKMWLSLSVELG